MGKSYRHRHHWDRASTGIGSIIVFIALVLVAGIAASVIIQVNNELEIQAMQSGSETTAEISSGIAVHEVFYHNNSGLFDLLAIEVQTRAGSRPIDLSETVVLLSTTLQKSLFTYDSYLFTDTADINGDLWDYQFYPGCDAVSFGVIVLRDADDSLSSTTPIMNRGDRVILTVNLIAAFTGLTVRSEVVGRVIAESGVSGVVSFRISEGKGDLPRLHFDQSATSFDAVTAYGTSVAAVSSDAVVIGYRDSDNHNLGTAIVGTISGDTIEYGEAVVFASAVATSISVTAVSSTHVVIAYCDNDNGNAGTAVLGEISGGEISFGEPQVFEEDATSAITITSLDATTVVIAYNEGMADPAPGTAIVGTISEGTIFFGSTEKFTNGGCSSLSISSLDDSRVILCYSDSSSGVPGTAVVGSVSGGSISYGDSVEFTDAAITYLTLTTLDRTHVCAAYADTGNENHGTAIVGTISGTTLSFGDSAEFKESATSHISADAIDKTHVVIAYSDGAAILGTVSYGDSLSFDSSVAFESAIPVSSYLSTAALDSTRVVIAFDLEGGPGSGSGNAIVGQFS
ncbi:MAG: hypothetical protein JXA00_01560 [Candidatus Thermoplasmatota archaeon]|nr:hypothetical protein [Candidatus Thermoplasmatota archaeon]